LSEPAEPRTKDVDRISRRRVKRGRERVIAEKHIDKVLIIHKHHYTEGKTSSMVLLTFSPVLKR